MGNCNKCTVTRLHALSYKGVRNRIILYILDHPIEKDNMIEIEHNQIQLADYLCVTRPALSKELNKMVKEGLIGLEKGSICILNLNALKKYILSTGNITIGFSNNISCNLKE